MQRRENYLYVGMDLHKETHTAVLVNCWNEKLEVIVIENKPSAFKKLAEKVNKKANFEVKYGEIAPWFDQLGGGIQYYTDLLITDIDGNLVEASVKNLLENGYIRIVK